MWPLHNNLPKNFYLLFSITFPQKQTGKKGKKLKMGHPAKVFHQNFELWKFIHSIYLHYYGGPTILWTKIINLFYGLAYRRNSWSQHCKCLSRFTILTVILSLPFLLPPHAMYLGSHYNETRAMYITQRCTLSSFKKHKQALYSTMGMKHDSEVYHRGSAVCASQVVH